MGLEYRFNGHEIHEETFNQITDYISRINLLEQMISVVDNIPMNFSIHDLLEWKKTYKKELEQIRASKIAWEQDTLE